MHCPQCNAENPEGARFCLSCAAPLVLVCSKCGTELPPHAKFCLNCAAAVAAPPASTSDILPERIRRLMPKEYAERLLAAQGQVAGERRLVTILFSDVKGSTAMAEGLDPEDVMEIMDGAFDVLVEPIMRYEGTLARLMGDAILAFFGAPIAHEDDAERACRAALEIVEGARAYAARLEDERGISGFNVRVGINTGLVVVGEVGSDLRVEYTAMGDAINLASRLESAAEPGTVLISDATHKFVAPLFDTQALGSIEVKGRAEPVCAHRVLSVRGAAGKVRGIAGLQSPLVGRAAEMATLSDALERLQAGVGGIITIVGEAGIGKSRLAAELHQEATGMCRATPLRWVEGRCLSYGTTMAYLLWLDILRSLLGVSPETEPADVAAQVQEALPSLGLECVDDVYPYLAHVMALPLDGQVEAKLSMMDGAELRARTFQAFQTLVASAASRSPLVLVCEDLHWADATSLGLLQRFFALTESTSLLIICLFRPFRDCGCWQLRERVARDYPHRHTDIWLDPLSSADSRSLVGNLLRTETLPAALAQRILSTAEGNPFFVEEILRGLIERGVLLPDQQAGGWTVTGDVADIELPRTLQGVLLARIDGLQEDTKRVLQMASVIGRIFLYRILAAIAEEEARLDGHLVTLQREEMIGQRARLPEAEYIFKHELTREAAYGGLLRKQRRIYHRQVAEALERLFRGRVEEQLGLLAYHWEAAGDAQKAVGYLLRAAQRDVRYFANQEAIAHFTRGLVLLESIPPGPERVQMEFALQMGLGAPVIATKGYGAPEVGRAWGRALELSQQMGDPPQLWPARAAICQYYILRAEYRTALEVAQQMADADERAGEALAFPFPKGGLGVVQFYLGHLELAKMNLEAMVARYDRAKHHTSAFVYGQDLGVTYLSYLAWVLWFLGHVDQALERSHEALGLAKALDHPLTLALALSLAGWLSSSCRDVSATGELAAAAAEVARERGFVFFQAAALGLQGWTDVSRGALEQGVAEIHRSLAMWQATGTESHRAHFLAWLAEACAKMGRIDEGLGLLAEALALVDKTGERHYEAEMRRLRGELLLLQGDVPSLSRGNEAEAEANFRAAIEVARRQSARSLELRATASLSRLLQQQGKREEARQMLSEIYAWFTEGFDTVDLQEAKALLDELQTPEVLAPQD
jgi:class 3 adenylate cyclase/predicted ATPase